MGIIILEKHNCLVIKLKTKYRSIKKQLSQVFLNEEVSFILDADAFEFGHPQFCHSHHDFKITGRLCLINNPKLIKLMTKI